MKARILLGLSMAVNLGLIGWLGLHWKPRANPPAAPPVTRVSRTLLPGRGEPVPPPTSAPARPREFHWGEIESSDYPTYITNLRAIGAPEKTIRDIVLADLERSYRSRIDASQPLNRLPFWRTEEQTEQVRHELNRQERELNREKRALIKALLGLDYDQTALEAWWEDQEFTPVLSFLPEPKPVEVIAIVNRFGEEDNEIDDRSGNIPTPEDVALKKSAFNRMLAELGQRLTPARLEEAELRCVAAMSIGFAQADPAEPKLTGDELRELIRLKWQWDSPLDEELGWPDEAFEEERRRGREEFAARARKLLGDARFAGFLLQEDSGFRPIYELAERHHLPNSATLQAYEIVKATTDELARVRRDRTLRASQRRAQMQEVRQSARQALRQTLGTPAFSDYLEQDAARWVVSPVKR